MITCFVIDNCFELKIETQKDGSQKNISVSDQINTQLEEINRIQLRKGFSRVRVINIETIYDTHTVVVWYERT